MAMSLFRTARNRFNGFAATREIRKQEQATNAERSIPIVALTANALQGDREVCLASSMDEYLSKPINALQLSAMLSQWLPSSETLPQSDANDPLQLNDPHSKET